MNINILKLKEMADNYVKDIQFLENSIKKNNGYLPKIKHWTQELKHEVERNEPDNRWILHCLDKLNYFVNRQEHRKNEYIR